MRKENINPKNVMVAVKKKNHLEILKQDP